MKKKRNINKSEIATKNVGSLSILRFSNNILEKFYVYYLAGYPVSGKMLAAGYSAKSVSGTTVINL